MKNNVKNGKYFVYVNFDDTKDFDEGAECVTVEIIDNKITLSDHELTDLDKRCILIKIEDENIPDIDSL